MEYANLFAVKMEIRGLDHLERDLNKLERASENALEAVASDISKGWKAMIAGVGAVDKRWLIESVAPHELSAKQFAIDTRNDARVIYSDVVERGRRDRPAYPARHPLEKALDQMESTGLLERRFEEEFDRTLNPR